MCTPRSSAGTWAPASCRGDACNLAACQERYWFGTTAVSRGPGVRGCRSSCSLGNSELLVIVRLLVICPGNLVKLS